MSNANDSMKSRMTSYAGMFAGVEGVKRIEIPLIQRDYAQGREGATVERIRSAFLDVLRGALVGGTPVGLDFVYGEIEDGTFRPLDGQQRLTTLFLLHWYIASRARRLAERADWRKFTYATRASARLFCERLVACELPSGVDHVSAWIEDQSWFQFTWKHDPTIRSMLVMVDAIDARFHDVDAAAAWEQLQGSAPAITFHVLCVDKTKMGRGEELYLKMNSRGKPLTVFENFKARFEKILESWCDAERLRAFAKKIDGEWSDVLWPYRGDDDIVDDEMMRLFHFATELGEWLDGDVVDERAPFEPRAESAFSASHEQRAEHLGLLFRCLDTWVGVDVKSWFEALFTRTRDEEGRLALFGREGSLEIDLFGACLRGYGDWTGKKRVFALPDTLLFYGTLLHRWEKTPEPTRSLRVVRNLTEASSNEIRADRMPSLLADVRRIVVDETLDGAGAFNSAQIAEERAKRELLATTPQLSRTMYALEDHPMLRGRLAAFDLHADPEILARRGGTFERLFSDPNLWPALTGALLAMGDYARTPRPFVFQLGSGTNEAAWREVFTAPAAKSSIEPTRTALGKLLDIVASERGDIAACLERLQNEWLASQQTYDWRWYFVKYPAMRAGRSGVYVSAQRTLGFDVCMLDKSGLNSNYRDPYLSAICRAARVGDAVKNGPYTGWQTNPRWMHLRRSGIELRCVVEGIAIRGVVAEHREAFEGIRRAHGIGDDLVLRPAQTELEGRRVDTSDRIELAATLLNDLVAAGL
jgi:hypothetical protein